MQKWLLICVMSVGASCGQGPKDQSERPAASDPVDKSEAAPSGPVKGEGSGGQSTAGRDDDHKEATYSCTGAAATCQEFTGDKQACTAQRGCSTVGACRERKVPRCVVLTTGAECELRGCRWKTECIGWAQACSSLSPHECNRRYCRWDNQGNVCTGSTAECETITRPNTCNQQAGCSWEGTCLERDDAMCGSRAKPADCEREPACFWDIVGCNGEPRVCGSLLDGDSCSQQLGCTWR